MTASLLPDSGLLFSLLVESVGESSVLYLGGIAIFRLLRIEDASLRSRVMLLPLAVPVLLGTVFHWLVAPLGALSPLKPAEALLHDLVAPLAGAEPVLVIIFGLAALFSGWQLLQGVATLIILEWRWGRQIPAEDSTQLRCWRLLEGISARASWPKPRLLRSQIPGVHIVGSLGSLPSYLIVQPALIHALDDEALEAVLAHEVAHLRQAHGPLAFVARLCRNLMWFNPAAHLAYHRFLEYQEEAADDGAVALTHNPLALAAGLVTGLRFRQGRALLPARALWGEGAAVERRIRRLTHYRPSEQTRGQHWSLLALTLISIVLFALVW